jgi:hypothetical protein
MIKTKPMNPWLLREAMRDRERSRWRERLRRKIQGLWDDLLRLEGTSTRRRRL